MRIQFLSFLIVVGSLYPAHSVAQPGVLQVGFYNLENLFDTLHDPFKNDYEYLPQNTKQWNSQKYTQKLNKLARSIASMNHWEGPDFLGVCEVENRNTLEDLISKTALSLKGYEIIHQESSDERGIDVAAIYKKSSFDLISYRYLKVDLGDASRSTRDILYAVVGPKNSKDSLHIFVNHWPSRFGGQAGSAPKRIKAAQVLRAQIDVILEANPQAKIILTGDFNDGTRDESITRYLMASPDSAALLFNTSDHLQNQLGKGSHKFRDEWNLFDQLVISQGLVGGDKGYYYRMNSSKIHDEKEWISEVDLKFQGIKPFRTYVGNQHNGGYSDHYSISLELFLVD